MTKVIQINEEQFLKLRQKIGIEKICENDIQFIGYAKVIHMEGSSKYLPKHYNTWSDYWREEIKTPIIPSNKVCDCCCEVKDEFVVGHITRLDNNENFLYPICKECNDKGKGSGNNVFLAMENVMQPFNLSHAYIEND